METNHPGAAEERAASPVVARPAVTVATSCPHIPHGEMSFRRIRANGWLYVDKARHLRPLEDERYAFALQQSAGFRGCSIDLRRNCGSVGVRRASDS